jgi:hypothetical protein
VLVALILCRTSEEKGSFRKKFWLMNSAFPQGVLSGRRPGQIGEGQPFAHIMEAAIGWTQKFKRYR